MSEVKNCKDMILNQNNCNLITKYQLYFGAAAIAEDKEEVEKQLSQKLVFMLGIQPKNGRRIAIVLDRNSAENLITMITAAL